MTDDSYHRMTLRYSSVYHDYLKHLSFKTDLDISQLIRLMIHLSPEHAEFNNIIRPYIRPDRRGILFVSDFRDNNNLWKKL